MCPGPAELTGVPSMPMPGLRRFTTDDPVERGFEPLDVTAGFAPPVVDIPEAVQSGFPPVEACFQVDVPQAVQSAVLSPMLSTTSPSGAAFELSLTDLARAGPTQSALPGAEGLLPVCMQNSMGGHSVVLVPRMLAELQQMGCQVFFPMPVGPVAAAPAGQPAAPLGPPSLERHTTDERLVGSEVQLELPKACAPDGVDLPEEPSCALDRTNTSSTAASEAEADVPEAGPKPFGQHAQIPFDVRRTFVSVGPKKSARRAASAPPRVVCAELRTVMLRNLPNRAKADRVVLHLQNLGFDYEAIYMPLDRKTGVNRGYAFVRLHTVATAKAVCAAVQHTRLPGSQSSKRLAAVFALEQGDRKFQAQGTTAEAVYRNPLYA